MTGQHKRVTLVTGASGGIGSAVSQKLEERPDRVLVLAGRDLARLKRLPRMSRQGTHNAPCHLVQADLSGEQGVVDLFTEASRFGQIVEWVHCMGTEVPGPVVDLPSDVALRILTTNILSVVLGAREFLRNWDGLMPITWVWIGSRRSRTPSPQDAVYASSKAALASFARSVKGEVLNQESLRITVIEPARVRNTGFGVGKAQIALDPQDVACVVAWVLDLPPLVEIPRIEMRHPQDLHPLLPHRRLPV